MRTRTAFLVVAVLLAAFTFTTQPSAQADTFGTSGNEFTIDFVNIGNAGNAADNRTNSGSFGRGSVPYEYLIGTYEISQDAIDKATASGLSNVTAGAWTGSQPAGNISWYEAAAFVNWLNTSTGKQAAYNLTFSNGSWSMALWSSADAWTAGGTNLYRHKDAFYFLPSENEWYKAAYFYPFTYFGYYGNYPTDVTSVPTAVASGTNPSTAVYGNVASGPAIVNSAGGLSPYGTMGQGGNMDEWLESAGDGTNNSASERRAVRGGDWFYSESLLRFSSRRDGDPFSSWSSRGFRVARVTPAPPPITNVILTVEKTTNFSDQWQFDREINVGPMTNTNEFYRLKIRTVVQ